MYVWIDALNNYVTGCGFPDENDPRWHYWPADVHIIGKDIVRFHTVYWPAFLMSAELPLPKRVFGHGFLLNKGEKMSKSVGNVVDPFDLADTYGVDQIRYFFMREVPFGQDGNYSHEAIVNRINADLANDLGNLAQRSLSMIAKNCDARVPQPGEFTQADQDILWLADALPGKARAAMKDFRRPHGPGGDLGRGGGGQPLFRLPGALGAAQERPCAHEHGALCHGRGSAGGRHPGPALRSDGCGQAARSPVGRAGGQGARVGRAGAPPGRRDGASATCADFPALYRGGGVLTRPL